MSVLFFLRASRSAFMALSPNLQPYQFTADHCQQDATVNEILTQQIQLLQYGICLEHFGHRQPRGIQKLLAICIGKMTSRILPKMYRSICPPKMHIPDRSRLVRFVFALTAFAIDTPSSFLHVCGHVHRYVCRHLCRHAYQHV